MTINEITAEIREQTLGLLPEGEIEYATMLALEAHGGIDPEDVERVVVTFPRGGIDIGLVVRDPNQLTLF